MTLHTCHKRCENNVDKPNVDETGINRQNYAINHQLLYNGAKTFSLCFKDNTIKTKQPSFFLNDLKIPMVENCRYLGITMSTKNSDLDLKRQMIKIYANANLLLRKFSSCSVSVKCHLFKTYCSTF